jgi:hypothetical protein
LELTSTEVSGDLGLDEAYPPLSTPPTALTLKPTFPRAGSASLGRLPESAARGQAARLAGGGERRAARVGGGPAAAALAGGGRAR